MFVRQPTRRRRHKPAQPHPSFPLTPHNNGQWCKKIRGKIHFCGIWEEPEAALENYLRVAADLHAGREPRSSTLSAEGLTVKQLCNHYLTYQHRRSQAGEIGARWFEDCRTVLDSFVSFTGPGRLASDLAPDGFLKYRQRLSRQGLTGRKGLGVYALTRAITVVRSVLKYAYEMNLIDNPIKYGKTFEQPSSTLKRKSRRELWSWLSMGCTPSSHILPITRGSAIPRKFRLTRRRNSVETLWCSTSATLAQG